MSMTGRHPCAGDLVSRHEKLALTHGLKAHVRHVDGHRGQDVEHPHLGGYDDQALDRLFHQVLEGLRDGPRICCGQIGDVDVVVGGPGGILDRHDAAGRTVLGTGGRQHPDRARVAGDQHAGGTVGPVLDLRHDLGHPRFGALADARMMVEHS
jgi:hypothetical protein